MSDLLTISGGIQVELDHVDYILAYPYNWCLDHGYPIRRVNRKVIYLHKVIAKRLGLEGKIDHQDRNKLNCKSENLREATQQQNCMNKSTQSNSSTGISGIYWHIGHQKYRAQIKISGIQIHLGYTDTLDEAIQLRQIAETKYFGEFAPNH